MLFEHETILKFRITSKFPYMNLTKTKIVMNAWEGLS